MLYIYENTRYLCYTQCFIGPSNSLPLPLSIQQRALEAGQCIVKGILTGVSFHLSFAFVWCLYDLGK